MDNIPVYRMVCADGILEWRDSRWHLVIAMDIPAPHRHVFRNIMKMSDTEKPDERPKCIWPIPAPKNADGSGSGKAPCGSEDRLFNIKGNGGYTGRERNSPVCGKHLTDALKKWNYDSAVPLDTMGKQG